MIYMKAGQRVKSTYKTSDGHFFGTIIRVITQKKPVPDPALKVRYEVTWTD